MLNSLIEETLAPLNVPIFFQTHYGDEDTYITYFQYDEQTSIRFDDAEAFTDVYMQINIFSKTNYSDLVKQVKDLMYAAGFSRRNEMELFYEDEWYQRTIRFMITIPCEN